MSAEVNLATTNTSKNDSNTNTGATRTNTTVYGYAPQRLWGTNPLFIKPAGEGSQVVYPITDHLGTPQMLVNQAGATVWEGQYSAFGIPLNQAGENNYTNSTQTLRFPGQYADSETQLYYNWNRYYDPTTGRYITSDLIGLYGGINTYNYALSNTLNLIDPLGLAPLCPPGQRVVPLEGFYDQYPKVYKCETYSPVCDPRADEFEDLVDYVKCIVVGEYTTKAGANIAKKFAESAGKKIVIAVVKKGAKVITGPLGAVYTVYDCSQEDDECEEGDKQ